MTALATELEFYNSQRDELLRHHLGQFVLIRDREMAGAFSLEKDAYEAGVKRFGTAPFLVKQVLAEEPEGNYFALRYGLFGARL